MSAVRLLARTLQRPLAGSMLVIALVVGLAGGLATGLVAGADRTRTSFDRFMAESGVLDLLILAPPGSVGPAQVEDIRELPGVEGAALFATPALFAREHDLRPPVINLDGRSGVDLDVARLLRGRAVDPQSATEIVLRETVARYLGLDVGDTLQFDSFSPGQVEAREDEGRPPFLGPSPVVEVVGISRHPADLISDDKDTFLVDLPPGFWRVHEGRIGEQRRLVTIDLGESPSPGEMVRTKDAALEIAGPDAIADEIGEHQAAPLFSTMDFVATAMLALAAAIGISGMVIGILVSARAVLRATQDTEQLSSLGMSRRQRAGAIVLALLPSAIAAGAVALVVAAISSLFLPFGLARKAEPDPGFAVDAVVFSAGVLATFVIVLVTIAALASRSGRRAHRQRPVRHRSSARRDLPVPALYGLDLALGAGQRGERAAGRMAITGAVLAAITASGAIVLAGSVNHLFATPAAYGWPGDLAVGAEAVQILSEDADVVSAGLVLGATVQVNDRPMTAHGIQAVKGAPPVVVTRGLPPGPGEIALGARTMADLDVGLGDAVNVRGAEEQRDLRVVGEVVLPGVIDSPQAGWGVAVQLEDLEAIGFVEDSGSTGIITLAEGVDVNEFARRNPESTGTPPEPVKQPVELGRLRQIQGFPWALTVFLATIGFVALMHALLVITAQRRKDLAVLPALGMRPAGLVQALFVAASVMALIGGVIGVPIGVALGQALWRNLARSLGVVAVVRIPWVLILLAALGGLVVLAGLAVLPVRRVPRTQPAAALRAE